MTNGYGTSNTGSAWTVQLASAMACQHRGAPARNETEGVRSILGGPVPCPPFLAVHFQRSFPDQTPQKARGLRGTNLAEFGCVSARDAPMSVYVLQHQLLLVQRVKTAPTNILGLEPKAPICTGRQDVGLSFPPSSRFHESRLDKPPEVATGFSRRALDNICSFSGSPEA